MGLWEEILPAGKSVKKVSENKSSNNTVWFGRAASSSQLVPSRADGPFDRSLRIRAVLCYTVASAVRHRSVRNHKAIQGAVENEALENGRVLL